MKRLLRSGVKAHADWKATVDAAFADATAFWKAARAFDRLVTHGKRRGKGFAAYAPGVLPVDSKGKPIFPPVWSNDDRTRVAIAGMSDGFCAYCQSPVSSSHPGKGGEERPPGQIEHFQPKSRFPARAYDWDNYFLSCGGCNNAKSDKWPVEEYVRPDEGKPGSRFDFAETGEIAARRKGDKAAENTVDDFDLKRDWLRKHRETAIKSHLGFVATLMRLGVMKLDELLLKQPVAFSEAINQCVRSVWAQGRGKKKP